MIAKDKFYSAEHLEDTLELIHKNLGDSYKRLQVTQRLLKGRTAGTIVKTAEQIDENNRIPNLKLEQQHNIYGRIFDIQHALNDAEELLYVIIHEIKNRPE